MEKEKRRVKARVRLWRLAYYGLSAAIVGMLSGTPVLHSVRAEELPSGVTRVALFSPGDSGYPTFRMEALAVSRTGTLLAFTEGRKGGSGVNGDVDLLLRRSTDGGQTWGPIQIAVDKGTDTVCYPTPLVDRSTGKIWLAMCMYRAPANQGTIAQGLPPDTCHTWITCSDDDGGGGSVCREPDDTCTNPAHTCGGGSSPGQCGASASDVGRGRC